MVTSATQFQSHPTSRPLALMFTDARGRIVFVDANFMQLMGYGRDESLVGEPLYKIIGLEQPRMAELMQEVARTGYVHEHPLAVRGPNGDAVKVLCSCVATYNERGEFIGADMTLHQGHASTQQSGEAPLHGDILQTRIQQIQVETEARKAQEEEARLQLYFTAQMNALQVLLARMGGPRIYATLEASVNQLADKRKWSMRMQSGHIILDEKGLPPEAYAALLKEVVDYGCNIIGRPPILAEMRAVDAQVGETVREAAGVAGLRQWIQ